MRDTQAFQIKLGIEHEILSKMGFEELAILRFENIERQRVAAFLDGVNNFFEFGNMVCRNRVPRRSSISRLMM